MTCSHTKAETDMDYVCHWVSVVLLLVEAGLPERQYSAIAGQAELANHCMRSL